MRQSSGPEDGKPVTIFLDARSRATDCPTNALSQVNLCFSATILESRESAVVCPRIEILSHEYPPFS